MRVAGILTGDSAQTQRLLELLPDYHTNQELHKLVFPLSSPVIVALATEKENSIQSASRADGAFAIFDGELYNAEEFRKSTGAENDAAALLELCLSQGEYRMAQADMAATLTIWDAGQGRLLVYRDRDGQKSSYYVERSDGILWSSDIITLLATDASWHINRLAVDAFLACGYVPAPWTFVDGIKKIPPGHVLMCEPGKAPVCRCYWRHHGDPSRVVSSDRVVEEFSPLFAQALSRRYSPKVKNGVLLSGGVDSKLVVAGLTKLLGLPGDAIDTFTFHYTEYEGKFNELDSARQAARHFGTRHHEIIFNPREIPDNLDLMLRCFEGPFTYGLHTFMLGDVLKEGIKVLLTGTGPDSWYPQRLGRHALSYRRFPAMWQKIGQARVPAIWRVSDRLEKTRMTTLHRIGISLAYRTDEVIWGAVNDLPSLCGPRVIADRVRAQIYLDKHLATVGRQARENLFRQASAELSGETDPARFSFLEQRFFGAECAFGWYPAACRAHALTVRHPYRDNRIVDLSDSLPRNKYDKGELRRFAATLMPREMAYAGKIAQSVPLSEWLRGPLQEFLRDTLSTEALKAQAFFDHKEVQRLIDKHVRGKAHHECWGLWAVLTVLRWEQLMSRTLFACENATATRFLRLEPAALDRGSDRLTVDSGA